MSSFALAIKSLLFHRRVNLAIALGVAAATAVLTGALIVGDSMRGSLRDLTLDRLGKIDSLILSEGFFSESLAKNLNNSDLFRQSGFDKALPAIFFPNGTVERSAGDSNRGVGQVNLLGITDAFWQAGDATVGGLPALQDGQVIINSVVAQDLGISESDIGQAKITIGIPRQTLLPSDSSLGDKTDLVERIVNLNVTAIVPAKSLGRFGLHPTQIPPRNVYLPIASMQDALYDGVLKYKDNRKQANLIMVTSDNPASAVDRRQANSLIASAEPGLQDLGLSLKRATLIFEDETIYDYFSLASDRLVLTEQLERLIEQEIPAAVPVITYLANSISAEGSSEPGVPFSMVTAVDFNKVPLRSISGDRVAPLKDNQIAITSWTADDQNLKIGDKVRIDYFEPETTHGDEQLNSAEFVVADIVDVVRPKEPPVSDSRNGNIPAVFDQKPGLSFDPDMTPTVPGLTDSDSITDWELPFPTPGIRGQDDDYWTFFRTTSKAYIAPEKARQLWSSRFGVVTSFRIPTQNRSEQQARQEIVQLIMDQAQSLPGLQIATAKADGLKASSGSTPFDVLFLSLSMFVIAAALALVSLLFRLALQKRSSELGTLLAMGFRQKQVGRIWLSEMLGVCLAGAIVGMLLGVGYAAIMIHGLTTWWVGAITTPFLTMHVNWWTLPVGLALGTVICVLTIYGSVRSARRHPVRLLMSGQIDSAANRDRQSWLSRFGRLLVGACGLLAVILTIVAATSLAGEAQAGAFMGSGFLILVAALIVVFQGLQRSGNLSSPVGSVSRLSQTNAGRNPLRSTLTIGLVAVASFLILAISAFRLSPTDQGTAGFDYLVTTSQPVFANLNTPLGQREILTGANDQLDPNSRVLSFRLKPGQDASCNNPYQSTQPQVLGVTPEMVQYFDDKQTPGFSFTMTSAENPWRLLDEPIQGDVIPVIIDKNTAWYSLKVYTPGSQFTVDYDTGQSVTFQLVGLLSNSVLQGTLLVSEHNFTSAFPDISGYRTFLMKLKDVDELDRLATDLSDQGFASQSTTRLLESYLSVQNTYLSTFQSLGLLGLLLGTFGLAAVQLRAVLERRQELGLMRAIGFTKQQLASMIMIENAWLLLVGMLVGIVAALVTTLPHYFFGDASIPWLALLSMFGFIAVVGLVTSWLASRSVFAAPLLTSLRSAS